MLKQRVLYIVVSKHGLSSLILAATLFLSNCQFRDISRLQDNQSNLVQFVNPRIGSQSDSEVFPW